MAYFPFFVDIENKKCLIVGGGMVASRKIEVLLDYGPKIVVVSPEMIPEIQRLDDRITLVNRKFEDGDLENADFVVAATMDPELNHRISNRCQANKIPVNVVDVKEECSFIFPALIKEQDITVGISTGGSSPTAAQYLKQAFREVIPPCYETLVEQLGSYRSIVKARVPQLAVRTAIFKEMVTLGQANGGTITSEQVENLIDKKLKEFETSGEQA